MSSSRLERAQRLVRELNLDAIIIANLEYPCIDPNFEYLLRPKSGIFERCFLVVEGEGAKLFVSKLEKEAAEGLGVEVRVMESSRDLLRYVKRMRRVGVNGKLLPYRLLRQLEGLGLALVDVSEELEELREVKREDEIEAIKRAVQITEEALREVLELDVRRLKESELMGELVYRIRRRGAALAFEPIVAYDENAALPHYTTAANDKLPERVVLIDVGARYQHYCADITRTFLLRRDDKVLEVYEAVLEAQREAMGRIKEGVTAEDVDKAARSLLEAKYPGRFIHSLGHMIGVRVHEGRGLRVGARYKLKSGMVFTVEPGAYFPGEFGVRIEDDVVVRREGAEVLSTFPKDLEDVLI